MTRPAGVGGPEEDNRGMRSSHAAWGSAVFFVVAPLMVGGLIPWSIGRATGDGGPLGARVLGVVLGAAGAAVVVHSFARFVAARGTPAPVAPTETLVVDGLYRFVRNPMYVGVVAGSLGSALWWGSWSAAGYAAFVWAFTASFVKLYEEPTLAETYGQEYDAYRASVRAWLPRLTPWRPG